MKNTETKLSALKTATLLLGILFLVLLFFFGGTLFQEFNKKEKHNLSNDVVYIGGCIPAQQYKPEVEQYLGAAYNIDEGIKIFRAKCSPCHKPDKLLIGPAMKGLKTRIPNKDWLFTYLTSEQSLVEAKDAYVLKLNEENLDQMNHNFKELNQEDLVNLSGYILGID